MAEATRLPIRNYLQDFVESLTGLRPSERGPEIMVRCAARPCAIVPRKPQLLDAPSALPLADRHPS